MDSIDAMFRIHPAPFSFIAASHITVTVQVLRMIILVTVMVIKVIIGMMGTSVIITKTLPYQVMQYAPYEKRTDPGPQLG